MYCFYDFILHITINNCKAAPKMITHSQNFFSHIISFYLQRAFITPIFDIHICNQGFFNAAKVQTSLPYFGVKLSCVCLAYVCLKKKIAYSYPKMTYIYPKVT